MGKGTLHYGSFAVSQALHLLAVVWLRLMAIR